MLQSKAEPNKQWIELKPEPSAEAIGRALISLHALQALQVPALTGSSRLTPSLTPTPPFNPALIPNLTLTLALQAVSKEIDAEPARPPTPPLPDHTERWRLQLKLAGVILASLPEYIGWYKVRVHANGERLESRAARRSEEHTF